MGWTHYDRWKTTDPDLEAAFCVGCGECRDDHGFCLCDNNQRPEGMTEEETD
jgi:hypothetical protein